MKRLTRLFTIIALLAFSFSNSLMAQPLPGGGGTIGHPTGDPLNGPIGAPIDNSVLLLVVIALAYGMYQFYQLRLLKKEA
jgi:hypothetical protein